MKNAVDLNRILLNFKLYQVDIKKVLTKSMQNSTFIGIIWESKRSCWVCILQAFKMPKIQNFGNHRATSRLYWVCYKLPFELHRGWNIWNWSLDSFYEAFFSWGYSVLYKSTIQLCMENWCLVWGGASSCYLELLDKL